MAGGILDQWMLPICFFLCGRKPNINSKNVRVLRAARFLRLMRSFKVVRAFLKSDLEWTEGDMFETAMASPASSP